MARPAVATTRRERREQLRSDRPERRRTYRPPKQRPMWQSPMVLISTLAVVVAVAIIVVNNLPKPRGELLTPPTTYAADLTEGESLGSASAPVTIEIWSDFQCPYCAQLAKEQIYRYVSDLVKPGLARVVAKDIDIIGRGDSNPSVGLAIGARCAAEQDRYWQYHDVAFWNQLPENSAAVDSEFIASVATAAGVDMTKWNACIGRADVRQAVLDTTAESRRLGISSTPTLRINGQPLPGGVPSYDAVAAYVRGIAASAAPSQASPSSGPSVGATTVASPAPSTAP